MAPWVILKAHMLLEGRLGYSVQALEVLMLQL